MKKVILCALAGGVVAQIWGMISWMVLPWHNLDFKQFSSDTAVSEVLKTELNGSGLYTLPNMDPAVYENEQALAEWNQKARKGPFAFMSVRAGGVDPGMGVPMAIGFFLNIAIAGILFWLVTNSSIVGPIGRTVFVAIAGSVGSLYPHISNWNWWHFPATYCIVGVVDLYVTWALAGFVMIKLADKLGTKKAAS